MASATLTKPAILAPINQVFPLAVLCGGARSRRIDAVHDLLQAPFDFLSRPAVVERVLAHLQAGDGHAVAALPGPQQILVARTSFKTSSVSRIIP
jgi:hypothetical protein